MPQWSRTLIAARLAVGDAQSMVTHPRGRGSVADGEFRVAVGRRRLQENESHCERHADGIGDEIADAEERTDGPLAVGDFFRESE